MLVGVEPLFSLWCLSGVEKLLSFLSCWTASSLVFWLERAGFLLGHLSSAPFGVSVLLSFPAPYLGYRRQKDNTRNSLSCPFVGPKVPSLSAPVFQSWFMFVLQISPGFIVVLNGKDRGKYNCFIFPEEEIPNLVFLKNIITKF